MNTFRKQDIVTLPNLLSLFRLALIPPILRFYKENNLKVVILLLALSALSDVLDGRIARRFHQVSDFGKILDPVADKLTQLSLLGCLSRTHRGLRIVAYLMAFREILLAIWGYLAIKYTQTVNSAKWYGKLCTVTVYASCMTFILFPKAAEWLAVLLTGLCAVLVLLSVILYGKRYANLFRQSDSSKGPRALKDMKKYSLSVALLSVLLIAVHT